MREASGFYRKKLYTGPALIEQAGNAVYIWAVRPSLKLNTDKTNAITFRVPEHLGAVLDDKLIWEPHMTAVMKQFNRVLYSMCFFRRYTTETFGPLPYDSIVISPC